jgi:hypothetical protein
VLKNKLINLCKKYWHVFVLVLLSLIPIIWFFGKGDAIINGVDTNFPLNPKLWLIRRFYMWNNLSNGGSDFSFAPAGIFFHLVQFVPYIIGLSLQMVEKTSLVFWFATIVVSSYIFSKNLFKAQLTRILFVCLYSLNIYMFNSWENVKVSNLSLVAGVPLLLHIFMGLYLDSMSKSKASVLLVFTSLILSGAGINPAYFITALLTFIIFAISFAIVDNNIKKVSKILTFIIGIIFAISSYWIFPTISFVLRSVTQNSSITSIGFNNWIDSLSANTSILNIMRLQGAWDWYTFDSVSKLPIYLPYVVNYFYRFPFLIFSFIVPSLALISLVYIDKKKLRFYIPFAIMLMLGIFLGSGTHEPTGIIFKWLAEHLPYFSLFRSPWYIFTLFVTLSMAGLIALLIEKHNNSIYIKFIAWILIVGNLFYSYPLITGKIFRPNSSNGFFVNFPDYLFDSANYLENLNSGRIITYPDDQLEKYKWGYTGVEPVVSLFIDKEVLFSGINNTGTEINQIIQLLYENIRKDRFSSVFNLANKLNATIILEKKDQHTLSPELSGSFDRLKKVNFEKWNIYFLNEKTISLPKIFLANNFYYRFSGDNNDYAVKALSILGIDQHLLNSKDNVTSKIFPNKIPAGKIIVSNNSQKDNYNKHQKLPNITLNRITAQNMTEVKFTFSIDEDGYYLPIIENYDLSENLTKIDVVHNSIDESWPVQKITDSHIFFNKIYLSKGLHEVVYDTSSNLIKFENFEGQINYKKTHQNDKAELTITENNGNKQLSILNRGDIDVSADFELEDFDFNNPYFIQLDYEWSHGNMSTVYVYQQRSENLIKTQTENLPSYLDRTNFNFYYEPVKTESKMTISLAAPFINNSLGTRVAYDNLRVYKLFMNDLFFISEPSVIDDNSQQPKVNLTSSTPVKHTGQVTKVTGPNVLVFAENYSPDWKLEVTDLNGSKIRFVEEHFTIDSYSNAWFIDTGGIDYRFEIIYFPQRHFILGVAISTFTIFTIILSLFKIWLQK